MTVFQELGKYLENVKSWNPQLAGTNEAFAYIDLSSVDKDKKTIDLKDIAYVMPETAPSRARQLVKKSDILVSTVRPNLNGVALVPEALNNATASTGYCVLRANEKALSSQYLFYWVQTKSFISEMVAKATGANYPAVSDKIIKQSKIPLPPLAEQQKIAAILDAADSLRQKDQQLVERYTALSQSLFLEMFGDPVTNPMGWETKSLQSITSKIGSGSTPRGGKEAYFDEGISLIRSLNIHDNNFLMKNLAFIDDKQADELANVIVEKNDVLLNITGASVCRCAIVPTEILPARVNQHVCILRCIPNHANPYYLLHLIISSQLKQKLLNIAGANGATREALTKSQISELSIFTPPIALQNQFAERIQLIEAQKQQAQRSLEKSEALFNSLLQRAFTGELTAKMAA